MKPARSYSITVKSFALALVVAFYTAGYLYINRLNAWRSRYYDVSLWFEKDLPFVPPMIFGYSLVFALVAILYLVIDNMSDLWNICIRFVNMTLICFAVFLIWPVRMNFRPEVAVTGDWITTWVGFYFWLDRPYNLFPSMHLAASFFSAFYLLKKGPVLGWTAMAMAVIVGVSVVLLKQHYILDVAAGFLVAWVCAFFPFRRIKAKFFGTLDYQNR
jgi:membrane-associated phospholipid phosphatase